MELNAFFGYSWLRDRKWLNALSTPEHPVDGISPVRQVTVMSNGIRISFRNCNFVVLKEEHLCLRGVNLEMVSCFDSTAFASVHDLTPLSVRTELMAMRCTFELPPCRHGAAAIPSPRWIVIRSKPNFALLSFPRTCFCDCDSDFLSSPSKIEISAVSSICILAFSPVQDLQLSHKVQRLWLYTKKRENQKMPQG